MTLSLRPLIVLFILSSYACLGSLYAQNCDRLGIVSNGFLLGEFDCDLLILSSDGGEILQPALLEGVSTGDIIRFSYEELDSLGCSDNIPLVNITCLLPLVDIDDTTFTTCNFDIESRVIDDSLDATTFELEVFNETDFGAFRPQVVEWYEYETGRIIGNDPVITYTPPSNSPLLINICADIAVTFPDGSICESTLCHTLIPEIVLPNLSACQALFFYQPQNIQDFNGSVEFFNLSIGTFDQVQWDFGDGNADTTTSLSLTHTYATPGLYEACLTLLDTLNDCNSTFCLPIFTVGGSDICNFNDCVFPGDANKDGTVNIFDVLNLGVAFNQTGLPRPNAVIDPILQAAFDWDINTLFNLNFKHIDCDGNGIVNELDYLAIDQNYERVAPIAIESNDNATTVSLAFLTDTLFISSNQTEVNIPANLIVADSNQPIQNFYGIGLSIDYDGTMIAPSTTNYNETSFMGEAENILIRQKDLSTDNQLGVAITRTNQLGINGSGNIAEVGFVIVADLIAGRIMDVQLDYNDLVASDPNGEEIPVNVPADGPKLVIVVDSSKTVSINEVLDDTQFNIYPNPTQTNLFVNLDKQLDLSEATIELFNTLGQQVIYQPLKKNHILLDIQDLNVGVYWVKINTKEGIGIREVIIH